MDDAQARELDSNSRNAPARLTAPSPSHTARRVWVRVLYRLIPCANRPPTLRMPRMPRRDARAGPGQVRPHDRGTCTYPFPYITTPSTTTPGAPSATTSPTHRRHLSAHMSGSATRRHQRKATPHLLFWFLSLFCAQYWPVAGAVPVLDADR